MKKLITVFLLLICVSISFSQSKKQQIETLTYKLDSINSVLLRSIDDNEKLSDTKLVLESKVSLLKNENSSKDSKISLLKNENASKNGEISLKNEKIESLTKEVKSLEQDYQLVVADLILKSDSLDSISLKLDSIINVDNTSERAWSSMTRFNTDTLIPLLQILLESRTMDEDFDREYNIKETMMYKRDDGLKTLVDIIYEQGFVICLVRGDYYILPKLTKCPVEWYD